MPGLGTLINVIGIIIGGVVGLLFGKLIKEEYRDSLTKACGTAVIFIGISGALEKMLTAENGVISSGGGLLAVISLALGALIGEILGIEKLFERFGEFLKEKTGSREDTRFVDAFVSTSFTVCIGAMAIVGSIQDGIEGDSSALVTKAVLDLITLTVMTCSLGKGCIFSAVPVALLQGTITAFSHFLKPLMTDLALSNLSLVGNILIFCVGINLIFGKKIRVANFLPAVLIAVIFAFLPFGVL